MYCACGHEEQHHNQGYGKCQFDLGTFGIAAKYFCPCTGWSKSLEGDLVNHPVHYTQGKIEVIDAIEGLELDYLRGNAVKYIARAPFKGHAEEDIRKAIWYLERYIRHETEAAKKHEIK